MKTTGNRVLITGGSAGIGLALATQFLQAGNRVIIVGRNAKKLADAQQQHPDLETVQFDLNDLDALNQLPASYPDVNILINNAGVQFNYQFDDLDVGTDKIATEVTTNLTAPMMLAKLFIPQMQQMEEAAIVNVSSGLGFVPKESAPVYCATKSAIHIFSRSLRWQLENTSIKVFEIVPPIVDTAMTAGRGDGKISPTALATEFFNDFGRNHYESRIGRAKQLIMLNRFLPSVADRIMRNGL